VEVGPAALATVDAVLLGPDAPPVLATGCQFGLEVGFILTNLHRVFATNWRKHGRVVVGVLALLQPEGSVALHTTRFQRMSYNRNWFNR